MPKRGAGGAAPRPRAPGPRRRDGDLEAELAREGDAVDAGGDAGERALGQCMKGSASRREVDVAAERLQQLAGLRAGDGDLGVLLGEVGDVDLEVPPFGLQPFLHPAVHPVGAAGGGVAEEAVLGQPHDDAVVEQEAVLVAHEAVAAAADRSEDMTPV